MPLNTRQKNYGSFRILEECTSMIMLLLRDFNEPELIERLAILCYEIVVGCALRNAIEYCMLDRPSDLTWFLKSTKILWSAVKLEFFLLTDAGNQFLVGLYNCELSMTPLKECSILYAAVHNWSWKYKPSRTLNVRKAPILSYMDFSNV